MDKTTIGVLMTGIVGLLPLIATTLISIFQGRSTRAHRDDAISVAKQRVEFLDAWLKSQETVSTPEHFAELKKIASNELDDIRGGVLAAIATTNAKPTQIADKHTLERWLLFYRPHSIAGWIWHTLFFMSGAMLITVALLTAISYMSTSDPYAGSFALVAGVPLLILAVIFRGLGALVDGWADIKLKADMQQADVKGDAVRSTNH